MPQEDSSKTLTYMKWEEFNSILQTTFLQTEPFTSACCSYQDNGYEICEHMRNGEQSDEKNSICSQFQSINIPKPLVLYRGVEAMYNTPLITGDYTSKAFSSTSTCPKVATTFVSTENKQETCCLLHIHIPGGTTLSILPICNGNNGFNEKEIVLAPNTRFQVIKDLSLLSEIQKAMVYKLIINANYADWFAPLEGTEGNFKFSIFEKDGIKIIPVTISQPQAPAQEQTDDAIAVGGAKKLNYKKTMIKKLVLGRDRIIYLLIGGRKEFVIFNKSFLAISEARKVEKLNDSKKNNKNK